MKRIALMLALLMLVASLVSCAAPAPAESTAAPEPTQAPAVTEAPEATAEPEPTEAPEPTEEPAPVLRETFGSVAAYGTMPTPEYKDVAVHDPSVIRADDGNYYIYGSHMAAAKTDDFMHWELISRDASTGCTLVENVQKEMEEALTWAHTGTFWAPCVTQLNDGRYYFYYCTCQGSSPLSALGVAVADKPEGPYKNLGVFLHSGMAAYNATQLPNVIDPHTFFDKEGKLWMVYGSYSGGIFILQMDPETGFPLPDQEYGTKLLGQNHARIEAPYIVYAPETDYYYLFLSFGGLEAGDGYNIRVARSKNPDGPYEDAEGQEMIKCGGKPGTFFNDPDYEPYATKVMGSYQFLAPTEGGNEGRCYLSPGHNSVYHDEEKGEYYLIFHTRFARTDAFSVRVHRLFLNEDGWFTASPTRYSGEEVAPVPEEGRAGVYRLLCHEHDINGKAHESVNAVLYSDGAVEGDVNGSWSCEDGTHITITLDGVTYKGQMNAGYDESQKAWTTVFTAMNDKGVSLWGIRNK